MASEDSPVRQWVTQFFAEWMPMLITGGLYVCVPPYDRERATVLGSGDQRP